MQVTENLFTQILQRVALLVLVNICLLKYSAVCSVHRSGENMMPTDLELNRVINNIQELLYSASDVSHDRCVKVLTARAKVRDRRRPLVMTSSKSSL